MRVKRYFAATGREALRALKEDLGGDAIVLANRAVEGGVEILALPADAVGAMPASRGKPVQAASAAPARPAPAPAVAQRRVPRDASPFDDRPDEDDYRVQLSNARAGVARAAAPAEPPRRQQIRPFNPPRVDHADYPPRSRSVLADLPVPPAAAPGVEINEIEVDDALLRPAARKPETPAAARRAAPAATPAVASSTGASARSAAAGASDEVTELRRTNAQLMSELSSIRGMLERQLAGFAWGETRRDAPGRADVLGELLEAGFSAALARQLAEGVGHVADVSVARDRVRQLIDRELRAISSDAEIIDRGGVFALVGPTGVGKTTTTAKLAARCVVRHGAKKLALITTDGYRIGAQEQLRIYGRILGVPVFAVRDAADLRQTLAELRDKHMVLIDTVGVSQRDKMVAEQAAMLLGAGDVRRLLLLNATCRGDTLDDVVGAYKGPDLAGCIITKVDEAASLAPALDVALRRRLELFYVANGQRVPEDLHLPNRAYLLHRALREQADGSPWKLDHDEAGFLLAANGTGV